MNSGKYFYRDGYMERLRPFMGRSLIKVVTGQRRVGKSYFLRQIRDEIALTRSDVAILEFSTEDERFMSIRDAASFVAWVNERVDDGSPCAIIIDEVQEISGFPEALSVLLAHGYRDIYCTGSNARFLSVDVLGRLSGRSIELRIHPLSYPEFLRFNARDDSDESLALYLRFGGMPFLHNLALSDDVVFEYLKGVYGTILYKDVIGRTGIRNIDLLERLVRYLGDNIGSIVSAKRIADFLKSQRSSASAASILEYLAALRDSCFINRAPRYDIAGKRFFEIGEKYFFSDLGLRHAVIGYRASDLGKILENVVYQHLLTSGWTVSVGQDDKREIDFVAERGDRKIYIQAALQVRDEATIQREFGNLLALRDAWPRYVVSLDPFASGQDGVRHIPLRSFLMRPGDW
jgi:predicted AAA+ superfamily ATPase